MNKNITHHHLTAEQVNDRHGPAIMLTQQDGLEEPQTIMVHPWQLRAVCEHFGLLANDAQAAKTIGTLQRRMVALRDRIESLREWMAMHSDHRHADLSQEMTRLDALSDLAREWCRDFDGEERVEPLGAILQPLQDAPPPECAPAPAPAMQAVLL